MEFHAATALASNVPTPVSVRLRAVQKQKKARVPFGARADVRCQTLYQDSLIRTGMPIGAFRWT